MVNSNADAMGIIFPNSYDKLVPELVSDRLMASIPFASRYRMSDFVISSMVNCGIDNISLIVRKNYHSLMDHLGSGREWDLTRKNGGLNIVPPFAQKTIKLYNGRVEALESIKQFIRSQRERYVILSDANLAVNFDFKALLDAHVESGADITLVYNKQEIPQAFKNPNVDIRDMYFTLDVNGEGRVREIHMNSVQPGVQNLGMNIFVLERELLVNLIDEAYLKGQSYFERDVLAPKTGQLHMQGYCYDGYVARINDMQSYFKENMKLLDENNLDALFSGNQIYTKIRDDNPTRYINGCKVKNVMAADGCEISGEVENCVLFRGVKIGKGAKVKNCVLMQDTVIEDGAEVEYLITDKNVTIRSGKHLQGNDTFQVYVAKRQIV